MRTRAAVLYAPNEAFKVESVELDEPLANEVLVRVVASGLCHSDYHLISGDLPLPLPIVGGHEGAGIVEQVGASVTTVAPGDHVIFSALPPCGHCRWCAQGRSNLCDQGALIMQGSRADGSRRFHTDGGEVGQFLLLGTFAERTVVLENSVVKIPDDMPLDKACLIGCGVITGWCSTVILGEVTPGQTVAVIGVGGLGTAAIQGARTAGARVIAAIDPKEFNLDAGKQFGGTHFINNSALSREELAAAVFAVTDGVGADVTVVTAGVLSADLFGDGLATVRKGGTMVVAAAPSLTLDHANFSVFDLVLNEKTVKGSLYGGANPFSDIPRLVELYQSGQLKLDEMITRTYTLDEVNQGYDDLINGRNVRGVILYDE